METFLLILLLLSFSEIISFTSNFNQPHKNKFSISSMCIWWNFSINCYLENRKVYNAVKQRVSCTRMITKGFSRKISKNFEQSKITFHWWSCCIPSIPKKPSIVIVLLLSFRGKRNFFNTFFYLCKTKNNLLLWNKPHINVEKRKINVKKKKFKIFSSKWWNVCILWFQKLFNASSRVNELERAEMQLAIKLVRIIIWEKCYWILNRIVVYYKSLSIDKWWWEKWRKR